MPREHAATMSSPLSPPGTVGNCVQAKTTRQSDAMKAPSRRLPAHASDSPIYFIPSSLHPASTNFIVVVQEDGKKGIGMIC
jgi:hypothetical protein